MKHLEFLDSDALKNTIRRYGSGNGTYTALAHARRQLLDIARAAGGDIAHPLPTLHAGHGMVARFGPDTDDLAEWCEYVNALCAEHGLMPIWGERP